MSIKVNRDNIDESINMPDDYEQDGNEHLLEPAANLMFEALRQGAVSSAHVNVGRVYDRKGYEHIADLASDSTSPYQTEVDDFYVRIAVRIPTWLEDTVQQQLEDVENATQEKQREEALQQLEEAERAKKAAEDRYKAAQRKVEQLGGK